jgi:hypothetical protein
MFNDYFIPFLNLCAIDLSDTHFETEGVKQYHYQIDTPSGYYYKQKFTF